MPEGDQCQPKRAGMSQFQRCITKKPNSAMNSGINKTAIIVNFTARATQFFLMFFPQILSSVLRPQSRPHSFVNSSWMDWRCSRKENHGIVLAREQRVHAQAGFRRDLLEAVAHYFVGDEYFALLFRQLIQSLVQFFQQHTPRVQRFRPGIGRRKPVFQAERLAFLRDWRRLASQCLPLLLAEQVGDAIAGDAEKLPVTCSTGFTMR